MHSGRTMREIPRVMRMMNPSTREILLFERHRVPVEFMVQWLRRSGLG